MADLVRPRIIELRAMDWGYSDNKEQHWLRGEDAKDWVFYPESVAEFKLIGVRTLFIRPDWEWPREERYRGLLGQPLNPDEERERLASHRELTYDSYVAGTGQDEDQLLVWNSERQPMESLGEGWLVLATTTAIKAIVQKRPDSSLHLWVERHSHGNKPSQASWHLMSSLVDRFSV